MSRMILALVLLVFANGYALEAEPRGRGDAVPIEHIKVDNDAYLEGYIQALVDMHFYEYRVLVSVEKGEVILTNLPNNDLLSESIVAFVRDFPAAKDVKVSERQLPTAMAENDNRVEGIWFPQNTVLFPPLIADPRQPTYSVSYRLNDDVVTNGSTAISIGDTFPLFRWRNIGKWHGDMQLDIEAAIFSLFDTGNTSSPLINTDFLLSFPLSYAFDKWAFRLRFVHVSAHLGDEFIVNNPELACPGKHPSMVRVNPSRNSFDLFGSYQITDGWRVYAGLGYIFNSDESYELDPVYFEYGTELRVLGQRDSYNHLYGQPFFAFHVRHWQDVDFDGDLTFALGYEWSKLHGAGRKVRTYLEFHNGYSLEGQFSRMRTNYLAGKLSWGF